MSAAKIFTLIPKIMADVGAIGKDRKNNAQNYSFRGIDDVYNALQPPMAKHGVFVSPRVIGKEREERQGKAGGALIYTVLTVEFKFYADDGSFVEAVTVGEAMDSGDKSANKAMSAALKYAFFQVFCIPTDDDNDTESHNPEPIHKKAVSPVGSGLKVPPRAVSSPFKPEASAPNLHCEACGEGLRYSEKALGFYCPQFKDKTKKHSFVPEAEIEKYKAKDPFSEGVMEWEAQS